MLHTDQPKPCDKGPELWFSSVPLDIIQAKALCKHCPVKLDCLEDALATEEALGMRLTGVHGGLEPHQRTRLTIRKL